MPIHLRPPLLPAMLLFVGCGAWKTPGSGESAPIDKGTPNIVTEADQTSSAEAILVCETQRLSVCGDLGAPNASQSKHLVNALAGHLVEAGECFRVVDSIGDPAQALVTLDACWVHMDRFDEEAEARRCNPVHEDLRFKLGQVEASCLGLHRLLEVLDVSLR